MVTAGGGEQEARAGGQTPARRRWVAALVVLGFLVSLGVLWPRLGMLRPRLTQEQASAVVKATLQRESRQAFVVTGALDLTVSTRVRNVRRLLPGLLNLSLGAVETTVRAPGRVWYGFRIDALPDEIRIAGDTIQLRIPPVELHAVEPRLRDMEVRTTSGWLRLGEETQAEVQQRATELVAATLRAQAGRHLQDSEQPRINTAETLAQLLRPAFQAAGIERPVFRLILDNRLVYTSDRAVSEVQR